MELTKQSRPKKYKRLNQILYMDNIEFKEKFWNFYLELENEFLEIEKTIPVHSKNYNTYSFSYIRLLGLICSDIDVLFKKFIEFKNYSIDGYNMFFYKKFIKDNYEDFISQEVESYNIRFNGLKFQPYIEWDSDNDLEWWKVNDAIKHNRNEKENGIELYKLANQKNVLIALSALFQLNMYFYKEIFNNENFEEEINVPLPESKIFILKNWEIN